MMKPRDYDFSLVEGRNWWKSNIFDLFFIFSSQTAPACNIFILLYIMTHKYLRNLNLGSGQWYNRVPGKIRWENNKSILTKSYMKWAKKMLHLHLFLTSGWLMGYCNMKGLNGMHICNHFTAIECVSGRENWDESLTKVANWKEYSQKSDITFSPNVIVSFSDLGMINGLL